MTTKKNPKNKVTRNKKIFLLLFSGLIAIGTVFIIIKYSNNSNQDLMNKMPERVKVEYNEQIKVIYEYDAEIIEIKHQLTFAPDRATRRQLKARKAELVSKRDEIIKFIYKNFEERQIRLLGMEEEKYVEQ